MAVAVGHKSSKLNAGSDPATITVAHDATGDNELIVGIDTANADLSTVTVTYAGVSMTQIAHITVSNGAQMWVFKLDNPTTGSNNIVATCTGSSGARVSLNAISFSGANGGAGTPLTDTGTYTSGTKSLAPTLSSGDMALGLWCDNKGNLGFLTVNQTSQWANNDSGGFMDNGGNTATGTGATTVSFSLTNGNPNAYALCAVPILASSGALTPSVTDSTAVSDTPAISLTDTISVSDSTAVSDTPTIKIVSFPSVTDSTAVSDAPTIRIGPIFFDATSSSPYEASLTTYNWQHTVGQGGSGILVIGVALLAAGTVSSITAGTKNAVFLRADSNGAYRSELWYVVNPDVGAQTITVNLSTSLTSIAGAISYFGVDQANPFEGTTGANGIGGSDTVNVITTDDLDTIVDVTSTLTNPISVGSGQVQRVNTAGALGSIGMADRQWVTPPGTKTANWTGTGALEPWAITATALVPAVDIQNISVSDSSAVSDSPIVEIIDLISVTDSTVVSDTPIIFIPILTIQVSDTTAVSDTPAIETIDQGINVTDSTVVSDTPTVEIISYVNATDSTAVSDIPTLEIISSINVSDSTAVSDTPTIEIISFINVTDSTAVLDTPILESILYINVTDTTTVSDVPAVSVVTLISVADSISVSDVPVVEIVSFINVTDSTVVSDTPVIFIPVLTIQVSDSTAVSDTPIIEEILLINVTDSTAVSDVPQFEEFSEISVTDTIVVTDSVVMSITLTVNVSDTVTVTDTPQIVERMSISAFNGIVRLGWKFGPYTMTL